MQTESVQPHESRARRMAMGKCSSGPFDPVASGIYNGAKSVQNVIMDEAGQQAAPQVATIVERNIQALLKERQKEEKSLTWSERAAQAISGFAGSMQFVFLHAFFYGAWIILNLPGTPSIIPKFDPTFVVLAMFASVESIFLSTFILITQNRMMKLADRRADLNLQVSLLAEHEVTRLIQMSAAICNRLGLEEGKRGDIAELSRDVRPEKVLETLDEEERESKSG